MRTAQDLLAAARARGPIKSRTLSVAWGRAQATPTAQPGKPIDDAEATAFLSLKAADVAPTALPTLQRIVGALPALRATGGTVPPPATGVVTLPVKRNHALFLDPAAGFVMDAAGTKPASTTQLTSALHHAGKWIQASYKTTDALFGALDVNGKKAVVNQLKAGIADAMSVDAKSRPTLVVGTVSALFELIKELGIDNRAARQDADKLALRDAAFGVIVDALSQGGIEALKDNGLEVFQRIAVARHGLKSDGLKSALSAAQSKQLAGWLENVIGKNPMDYAAADRVGLSTIVVDKVCGQGENFLYGFVKSLTESGLDEQNGGPKFKVVSGDPKNGPCVAEMVVPVGPFNTWGRPMTIRYNIRSYASDRYANIDKPNVNVLAYGGHANFGTVELTSIENAPANQVGEKAVYSDECCQLGVFTPFAQKFPRAAINMIGSVESSLFRTQQVNEPGMWGTYASDSEGFQMMMADLRVKLRRGTREDLVRELENRCNWYGHSSNNNWYTILDDRFFLGLDINGNGIGDVHDMMPAFDTTDVAASTANEFDFKIPALPVDQIGAKRHAQAMHDMSTFANYNPELKPAIWEFNNERKVQTNPQGMFFDAKDKPNELMSWELGTNGELFGQWSSATDDMTYETLRPMQGFSLVRFMASPQAKKLTFANHAEEIAMALIFASSFLAHDRGYRDSEIFENLKKAYGIPAAVTLADVNEAREAGKAVDHNDYTGNTTAVAKLLEKHKAALMPEAVGKFTGTAR